MAPGAQLNSPLPAMGSSDPTPLPPPASSQASEPLRGLRRYKMINLVGDGTYGLVYLAYNVIASSLLRSSSSLITNCSGVQREGGDQNYEEEISQLGRGHGPQRGQITEEGN